MKKELTFPIDLTQDKVLDILNLLPPYVAVVMDSHFIAGKILTGYSTLSEKVFNHLINCIESDKKAQLIRIIKPNSLPKGELPDNPEPSVGQVWKNEITGVMFMIFKPTKDEYVLCALHDVAHRWTKPNTDINLIFGTDYSFEYMGMFNEVFKLF